jgi:hypothetical protein
MEPSPSRKLLSFFNLNDGYVHLLEGDFVSQEPFRTSGISISMYSNFFELLFRLHRYNPTIESTQHKTIRFRKVHFATDIVDTAGMVSLHIIDDSVSETCLTLKICIFIRPCCHILYVYWMYRRMNTLVFPEMQRLV